MKTALAVLFGVLSTVCVALFAYPILYGGGWSLCTTPLSLIAAGIFCIASYAITEDIENEHQSAERARVLNEFFKEQEAKNGNEKK